MSACPPCPPSPNSQVGFNSNEVRPTIFNPGPVIPGSPSGPSGPNGIATFTNISNVQMPDDKSIVQIINSAPTTVAPPINPTAGDVYTVVDKSGNAGTFYITITGIGVIIANNGTLSFYNDGISWSII